MIFSPFVEKKSFLQYYISFCQVSQSEKFENIIGQEKTFTNAHDRGPILPALSQTESDTYIKS